MAVELNKANSMLSKLRHVLDSKTLRSVCYAVFESHLCYVSLIWTQNTNSGKRIHLLQKKVEECCFRVEILMLVLYLDTLRFLSALIKMHPTVLLASLLNHTLM